MYIFKKISIILDRLGKVLENFLALHEAREIARLALDATTKIKTINEKIQEYHDES